PVESHPAKVAAAPPAATTPPLPPNLQPLVGKSDVELEALLAAGFLTAEELAAVRAKASHP
ncbi:MAG TPA: SHOCT domain-containing protein, partial [Candidatus Sumerlaeota bacterium]|nr:SHOCT domain-containing protein [Candidatus Sumerlaeota bacterium]